MDPSRGALVRYAAVLRRSGAHTAGEALRRAAATKDPSPDAERHLRSLLQQLAALDEHATIDALAAEVRERSGAVGTFAQVLARRGDHEAVARFLHSVRHSWDITAGVDGALGVLVTRASPADRAYLCALTGAPVLDRLRAERVERWTVSLLAQALAWIDEPQRAEGLLGAIDTESAADPSEVERAQWLAVAAPARVALGDDGPADELLRRAQEVYDRVFDEDLDGYGEHLRSTLRWCAQRVDHLRRQRALPLDRRAWESPTSLVTGATYASRPWRDHTYPEACAAVSRALREGDDAAAFGALSRLPRDASGRAQLLVDIAAQLPRPGKGARGDEVLDQLCALRGELDRGSPGRVNWYAWTAAAVVGSLARGERYQRALTLADELRGAEHARRIDYAQAVLAVSEEAVARRAARGALGAGLAARLAEVEGQLAPWAQEGDTLHTFRTPVTLAMLLRARCGVG